MKQFRWLMALVVGAFLLATVAWAASVEPIRNPDGLGNPSCYDLGFDYELKSDTGDSATVTKLIDGFEVVVEVVSNGTYFDFYANVPVKGAIAKGGPNANFYDYRPDGVLSDTGLVSPDHPRDRPAGLSHATFCFDDPVVPYLALGVEKDAEGTYDRTVEWKLEKTVDPDSHEGGAGELAGTSTWTVVATKNETVGNFEVTGSITITNPNTIDVDFDITDTLNDGTTADVDCPTYTVPAKVGDTLGQVVCTYEAFPADDSATENEAVVTVTTPNIPASDPAYADVSFVENLIGFDEGTLSDPRFGLSELIDESTTKTFPEGFYCSDDASDYTDGTYQYTEVNWAYLNDDIDLEASATVTVTCELPALEVEKTAEGSFDRTVEWELAKSVDPDFHSGGPGAVFDSIWTVVATKSETVDSFKVTGSITITNDAAIDQDFTVSDVLDDGTVAVVTCPADSVPAGESVVCTYEAFPADDEAELNTATVSAVGNADQIATADVSFTENLIGYDEGTLSDPRFGFSEVIDDSTTQTFPETFVCPAADSELYVYGFYTFDEVNTATLNGNIGLEDSATVTVECRLRFQDETAWAANGDAPLELRYSSSNWATYVEYFGVEKTTTLFAGQTIPVGTVEFSDPVDGYVTIYVSLDGAWIVDPSDMTLAVQDYANAPSGNPSPGLFDHKATCDATSCTIYDVPENNFYGVHVNVGTWY